MQLARHVQLMAEYNRWMNRKLYDACEQLSVEQISENRGAFFGSVLATLNHLLVGDIVWLKRFAVAVPCLSLEKMNAIEVPKALDAMLSSTLTELREKRDNLDEIILAFGYEVSENSLQLAMTYKNFQGVESTKMVFSLMMHLFNHQTHHRGQVTTLLSQFGVDIGVTDFAAMLPQVET